MSCLTLAAIMLALLAPEKTAPTLKIGDPAPALAVSRWVKGQPVKQLEPGKTYVDDVPAGENQRVNGRMRLTWLAAAGQRGIPCAFIIGLGKVACIDHPRDLCAPLDRILADGWDFAAAERVHRKRAEVNRRYNEVVQPALDATHKNGPPNAETLAELDKIVAADPELELGQLTQWKLAMMLRLGRVDDALRCSEKLVDSVCADRPTKLTAIAWLLTEHPSRKPNGTPDYTLALKAATRACELCHHAEPQALEILAQVDSAMGQSEKALETELKAFQFAINPDDEMKQRLEQ
jgi:tetratricopeptide (TPR) repeat protein